MQYSAPIELRPKSGTHKSTVIMLHGLGDTGAGWEDIGHMFGPQLPDTKFIFPNAPRRPITLNWGMSMPGWFDIASLEGINQEEDTEGITESKRYVEGLVQKELDSGIPSSKVIVGGFSQGGAVALTLLRSDIKLGAILGLSSWLPLRKQQPCISEANKDTPILMCHGDSDQVVAFEFGKMSFELLSSLGAKVEFQTYIGLPHSACQQEFNDILAFIKPLLD